MSTEPVSDGLNEGVIEDEYEECDFCGGKVGEVNGLKACEDCHTTPAGNFIDDETNDTDDSGIDHWPYKHRRDKDRDTYSTYSVRLSKKPVILYGGFEEAYRDPSNGLEYCIEEYGEHDHHDGLVLWH